MDFVRIDLVVILNEMILIEKISFINRNMLMWKKLYNEPLIKIKNCI